LLGISSFPRFADDRLPTADPHKIPSLIIGGLVISVGALFYAYARYPGATPWDGVIAGAVWGSFPSFVHVLGMSFLTLATLPARLGTVLAVGSGWFICNGAYELASHLTLDGALGRQFAGDPLDVAAAAMAAMVFWVAAGLTFLPAADRGKEDDYEI
jgi:hypothetical protein